MRELHGDSVVGALAEEEQGGFGKRNLKSELQYRTGQASLEEGIALAKAPAWKDRTHHCS